MRFPGVAAILCLVVFCFPATAGADELPILRVAVEDNYPPFSYADGQGRLAGFDIDIARALCAEMGRKCAFVPRPFGAVLPAFAREEIDMAVVGMGVNEAREKQVLFTDLYYQTRSIFVEKKGTGTGVTPEDLTGLRIAAKKDTMQEEYVRSRYGQTSSVVTAITLHDVFGLLREGEADVALVEGLPGYAYLKTKEGLELEAVGDPVKIAESSACIAVSKKLPGLRDALNKALRAIRENGVYEKINYAYFDFLLQPPVLEAEK